MFQVLQLMAPMISEMHKHFRAVEFIVLKYCEARRCCKSCHTAAVCIATGALPLLLTGLLNLYFCTSLYLQTGAQPHAALVRLFVCRISWSWIVHRCWI
jgi:hypothetical protein